MNDLIPLVGAFGQAFGDTLGVALSTAASHPLQALMVYLGFGAWGRWLQRVRRVLPTIPLMILCAVPLIWAWRRYAQFRVFVTSSLLGFCVLWVRYVSSWPQRLVLMWLIAAGTVVYLIAICGGRWVTDITEARRLLRTRYIARDTMAAANRNGTTRVGRVKRGGRTVVPIVTDQAMASGASTVMGAGGGRAGEHLGAIWNTVARSYGEREVHGVVVNRRPSQHAGHAELHVSDGRGAIKGDIPFPEFVGWGTE